MENVEEIPVNSNQRTRGLESGQPLSPLRNPPNRRARTAQVEEGDDEPGGDAKTGTAAEDPYLLGPTHVMVVIGEAVTKLLRTSTGQAAWRDMWTGEEARAVIHYLRTSECFDSAVPLRDFLRDVIGPAIKAALLEAGLDCGRFVRAWDASLFALARPGESRWPEYGEVVTLVLGFCDQQQQSLSLWEQTEDEDADENEGASSCYTIRCLEAIEYITQKIDNQRGEPRARHFYINVNPGRCAQEVVKGAGKSGRRCMACKLPPGVLELSRAYRSFVFSMLHAMRVQLRHACAITAADSLGPLSLAGRPFLPGAAALVCGVSEASTIHPSKVLDLAHRFHSDSFNTAAVAHLVSSIAPSLATGIELGKIIEVMASHGGLPKVSKSFNPRMMAGPIASLGLDSLSVVGGVRRGGSCGMPKRLGPEELAALLMDGVEEGDCGHRAEELLRHGREGRLHPTLMGLEIMAMLRASWEDTMEEDDDDDDEALWEAARSMAIDALEAIDGLSSAHSDMLMASWKVHFLHLRRQAQARACGEPSPCLAFGTLEAGVVLLETWTRGEDDGEDPDHPLRRTSTGSASQTFAWHGACWGSATDDEQAAQDVKETARRYTSLPRVEAALEDKLVLTLYGINDGGGMTSNGHRCPSYEACLESAEWLLAKVLVDPEILPHVRHVVVYGQPPVRAPKDRASLDPLSIFMQQADVLRISDVDVTEAGRRASGGLLAPELSCQRIIVSLGDYEGSTVLFMWSRGQHGLMQGSSVASLGKDEGKMAVMREMPAPILLHRYAADALVVRSLVETLRGVRRSSMVELPLPCFWRQPLAVIRSAVGGTDWSEEARKKAGAPPGTSKWAHGGSVTGLKIVDGRGKSQDKDKAWLAFKCPHPTCKRKGQKFTRRNGSKQRVQAKPIIECLTEGHIKVYSNGQSNYPVIDGPSKNKFDEQVYPVRP